MASKQELDRLIDEGDPAVLLDAIRESRARGRLLRRITARLPSTIPAERWRAVAALGTLAAEGGLTPARIREQIRRFLWALSDESGSVPFGIPEALGAILAARPELQTEFVPMLVSYLVHEEVYQSGPILAGAIWAIGHVGNTEAGDRDRLLAGLRKALSDDDALVRGAALWTLTRLGLQDEVRGEIEALAGDDAEVTLLEDAQLRVVTLATLAAEA